MSNQSVSEKSSNVTTHSSKALEETKSSKDDLLGPMTTSTTVTNPSTTRTNPQTTPITTTTSNPTKDVFGDSLKQPFGSTTTTQSNPTVISNTNSGGSTTTDNKSGGGSLFGSTTTTTQQNTQSGQNTGGSNPFGNKPANPPKKTGLFG